MGKFKEMYLEEQQRESLRFAEWCAEHYTPYGNMNWRLKVPNHMEDTPRTVFGSMELWVKYGEYRITIEKRKTKNFLTIYKYVEEGKGFNHSLCGQHFDAEQMADLLMASVFAMHKLKVEDTEESRAQMFRMLRWTAELLGTRRQKKYYTNAVYNYKAELKL